MALPRYHVYASFNADGRNTGWVSGKTIPLTPMLRNPNELKAKASARYGKPGHETERELFELMNHRCAGDAPEAETAPVGRRVKR